MKTILKELAICIAVASVLAAVGLYIFMATVGWPLRAQDAATGYENSFNNIWLGDL